MKLKAEHLVKLVNELVEKRVREILPEVVSRVLAEQYLRKIVESSARLPNKTSLRTVMESEDDLDDEVPEILPHATEEGIYGDGAHTIRSESKNPLLTKLLNPDNPLNFVYEGVKPIPQGDVGLTPDIPVDKLSKVMDFGKMSEMVRRMENRSSSRTQAPVERSAPKFDPRLDSPVNGQSARQRMPSPVVPRHPQIEGDVFPNAPITFDD